MSITLADPYLKTSRANVHLEILRQELKAFRESQPCALVIDDDRKNQRCRVRVRIKDVPDTIPLIVGDVLYNLRSSLDQLVWCLAKLTLPYPKHTEFPILEERDNKRMREATRGVPAKAVGLIESLQPYHGGKAAKNSFLWRLNKLCNIDKHMRIPVHTTAVTFQFPANILRLGHFENDGVMNIPLSLKAELKRHMTLNPDVPLQVIFGDSFWDIECEMEELKEIYDFVADKVVPRFASFFK